MHKVTRRKFLQYTGGSVATGLFAPLLSMEDISAAAINRPLPPNTPILVLITLYGGNDGINTVIPYTDQLTTHHDLRFLINQRACCHLTQS